MWNKNERQGKADEAKGHIKQAVAAVTGSPALKVEGKVDVAVGRAKSAIGTATRKVDEVRAALNKPAKP